MSTISASTTSTTAFKITTDTTGALVFQTGVSPTTAMTLGSDQSVTFAGTPTYSGGTANGVAYLNGSKVLTTGTALVFDGTNLGVGTATNDLSPGAGLTTRLSLNAPVGFAATNVNTGTATYSVYQLGNNNTANRAGLALFGASYTSSGLYRQDGLYLYTTGAGGMTLSSEGAQPIYFATNNTERARIDANGYLGVGTSNPTARLEVAGSATNGSPFVKFTATSDNNSFSWVSTAFASNLTAGTNLLHFIGKVGSSKNAAWFGYKHSSDGSNSNLLTMGLFGVDNVLNVNGNANVSLYGATTTADGVGVTFPASQSASTNANCLDDYEEGTWTPVITGSGGGTLTYNFNSGVYRKVGSMVYVQFGVNVASRSGGSGEILIDGLPFTSISRGGYQEPANGLQSGGWATPAYAGAIYMFVMNSMTQMRTRTQTNSDVPGDFTSIQAGTYMNGIMVYCAA